MGKGLWPPSLNQGRGSSGPCTQLKGIQVTIYVAGLSSCMAVSALLCTSVGVCKCVKGVYLGLYVSAKACAQQLVYRSAA